MCSSAKLWPGSRVCDLRVFVAEPCVAVLYNVSQSHVSQCYAIIESRGLACRVYGLEFKGYGRESRVKGLGCNTMCRSATMCRNAMLCLGSGVWGLRSKCYATCSCSKCRSDVRYAYLRYASHVLLATRAASQHRSSAKLKVSSCVLTQNAQKGVGESV
eukprot:2046100-Rhodomonas_salina.1